MSTPSTRITGVFFKTLGIVQLLFVFLLEVFKANLAVIKLILSPKSSLHPAIVKIPIDLQSDWSIFWLTQMITLTPGTLSLDVHESKKFILVHMFHSTNVESSIADIKRVFEAPLKRLIG